MQHYKEFFKNKKITVMGLGILGRGLGYTKFMAECGADLIVTDLKTKEQLATSLKVLSKFKNIKFVIGEHRLEDFKNRDMIMKAAGVPFDSVYIAEAKKNKIPVEMDVSLFKKLAQEVKIVGVTGTRGKSMTTTLIYELLSKNLKNRKVYLGGNIRGVATLPLLKKVKPGDILVCELDSWQLQGFGDAKISPDISVFTSFMPDHMNYYRGSMEAYFDDKAHIFRNQKKDDVLIIRPGMKEFINKEDVKGKLIVINKKSVAGWKFIVPGEHQQENLACAVKVAEQFDIPINKIKKTVAEFKGVEGRLEFLKNYKGIKIYNDNNATTPEATIAGIEAVKTNKKNIVLLCGGADKKLDLTNFVKIVNKNCKAVALIPGSGTDVLLKDYELKVPYEIGKDFKEVVSKAIEFAKKGDIILFSPAFASFGLFNNEYERNDLFVKLIKKL
ncbi:MAG TPA: UDP-N-acetylmuramoyl-L-alanine--D-glutamate ligase, partial [Candidatus Paceibacterota bacterium]|nr:UDP-N-acetylmuramoyl-L-alanine--D-glutamate ligase [Candidatus Paceibacterota bacterium]